MSTTSECRREETGFCQPDRAIIVKPKSQAAPAACDKTEGCSEEATMTEKQFMRDHTLYSAISSWLFAISGATNLAILGVLSSKILTAVEQGKPIFKSADPNVMPVFGNKKFNRIALGIFSFGAACMALSNWLESKKVVTEWRMLAKKQQMAAAVNQKTAPAPETAEAAVAEPAERNKSWVASVQSETAPSLAI